MRLKKVLSFLELEGRGRVIIMGVTRLLLERQDRHTTSGSILFRKIQIRLPMNGSFVTFRLQYFSKKQKTYATEIRLVCNKLSKHHRGQRMLILLYVKYQCVQKMTNRFLLLQKSLTKEPQ